MRQEQKSVGWRVPILFCGFILFVVGGLSFLKNKTPDLADSLPPELIEKARNSGIDMNTAKNREWQERIIAAASGFSAREDKDRRLLAIVDAALSENNFEAACAAFSQMGRADSRQAASDRIFRESIKKCDDLIWGVYAAVRDEDFAPDNERARELGRRWEECQSQ